MTPVASAHHSEAPSATGKENLAARPDAGHRDPVSAFGAA